MSRVLIDTQALIWFAEDASALSLRAIEIVDDASTVRLASAVSVWEMAIKISLGKLTLLTGALSIFVDRLKVNQIEVWPVTADDAMGVLNLSMGQHKDPFDRLIAAQCLRHDLTLISADKAFDGYGVRRVW